MLGRQKKPKMTRVDSLIGQHTQITGDLRFSGGLHVDGTIRGNISAEEDDSSVLTLSDRGTIEGEVAVPYVILNGVVIGDVKATQHVELAANARVEGDVYYRLIEMAVGAEVNGKLVHLAEAEKTPLLRHDEGFEPAPQTD
jgi:cytoskeletal protein CcmA (bactofilin family)